MEPGFPDLEDDLATLRALGREAEALSRRFAAGDRAVAEVSAHDPAGCVRVVLSRDGRIATVEVIEDWDRRLAPDQIGAAVLAACEQASLSRSQEWANAVSRAPVSETAAAEHRANIDETTVAGMGIAADPTGAASAEFGRRLFHVLQDVSAGLDDLVADATRCARQTLMAQDPQGNVTVTLTGDVLTGVSVDIGWLASARHAQIGAAITAAVHAGYSAFEQQAGSVPRRWPFDELDRLTADPMHLLSSLGLPIPHATFGEW